LISGPTDLKTPEGVSVIQVISADEMLKISMEAAGGADLFIAESAVADYRPQQVAKSKLKKQKI
jgi:phosphopantothenoylcysteine decarboxylase / phosphopantothenate---cysteine ligase